MSPISLLRSFRIDATLNTPILSFSQLFSMRFSFISTVSGGNIFEREFVFSQVRTATLVNRRLHTGFIDALLLLINGKFSTVLTTRIVLARIS